MDQMKNFTTYEYKEITVRSDKASLYLDCYESFGWKQNENFPPLESAEAEARPPTGKQGGADPPAAQL